MIRPFKGIHPRLGERVYVDVSAQVIGDVEVGDHASVWMNAVVRGDVNYIRIGAYTNIQDNSILHVQRDPDYPTILADHVTVGHSVTLHGCRVDAWCLIGIGALVLNGAHVGAECIVAAGSLVPERMVIPPASLVMGSPARVRRPLTEDERKGLRMFAESYYEYKEIYLKETEGR
jgi:carbonic anhydrase/acetyltransferase-like protein (isoleucine patch superfamily)